MSGSCRNATAATRSISPIASHSHLNHNDAYSDVEEQIAAVIVFELCLLAFSRAALSDSNLGIDSRSIEPVLNKSQD
jgi:hypothetical protein